MRSLLVLLSLIVCSSCAEHGYFSVVDFENETWNEGQNAVFDFTVTDTRKPQDINILLRYRPLLEGHRVKLMIKTSDAKDRFWVDTIDVVLKGESGNAVLSQMVSYRGIVMWPTAGKHSISLSTQHALGNIISAGVELR